MLNGKIGVAKGFQTSVNVAYDLNNADKMRGFIPTQSGLDVIEDVLLSTSDSATQRARILIGAYGRGKSHIVLVLMSLLSQKDKTLFPTLLNKMREVNPNLYEYALNYLNSKQKLLPVIIRGSSTSLSSSFLSALQLTLNEDGLSDVMPETHFQVAIAAIKTWESDFAKTYEEFKKLLPCPIKQFLLSLQEYDVTAYEKFTELYPKLTAGSVFNPFLGLDVVDLYEDVAKKVKDKGYCGIYVVYDEFSKYLESSIANATINDIKLLQDFAEKCSRSGDCQMHLLLICHKDIANYIDGGLPKEKVDGWRGVSGRFKHINLHNNYAQMYEIIKAVIVKDNAFWSKFQKTNAERFGELADRFTKNRLLDKNNQGEIDDAIRGCYPLHPISTFVLPRLSERVAQNERTLFTFLSSDERCTLSSFLGIGSKAKFPLLTPDYIYDYFEPLLRKEPYTSEAHKTYKLTTTVLQKVEQDSLEAKILKTIALIYLVEQFEKLPPMVDAIADAFRDTVADTKEINDALASLIENECVVYLKRSNGYLKIKESSGVNIEDEISLYIERRSAALRATDILNGSAFDSYMYPTSYNDHYEITRYFDFTFIRGKEYLSIGDFESRINKSNADGIIYAIVPESADELKKIGSAVKKAGNSSDRLIVVLPTEYKAIDNDAFEYEAVKSLRLRVPESENVLADEYDIYIDDLTEVIGAFINSYARPENGKSVYYHKGKQCKIFRKTQLTKLLSDICAAVFHRTPIINNESVNKNTLPSVAINSRTKLIAGLLENELKPNLGLIGTGQEVSIMRSTLVQTGVLVFPKKSAENPYINLEPTDEDIANMLAVIQTFFAETAARGMANFQELYDRLTLPQNGIGLKRGIIPIYIAAVLHLNKKNLVIKHRDREERITPDLLNSINEVPDEFSVMVEDWSEEKAEYIHNFEDLFRKHIVEREKIYNGFSYILFAMNRWYMGLPKYAKEVPSTDKSHSKFINSLKMVDENPREYLFVKLMKMFNHVALDNGLIDLIRLAKEERDTAIAFLIRRLTENVKTLFAGRQRGSSLSSSIKDWYEKLNDATLNRLFKNNENQILSLLATVGNDDSAFIQRLAKAVCGLRVEDWTNETVGKFIQGIEAFKQTVESFNNKEASTAGSAEYKIIFTDADGTETVRVFDKAKYSDTAELMLGEVARVVEEYNQSITEQEKRQVLVEILERLCRTEG